MLVSENNLLGDGGPGVSIIVIWDGLAPPPASVDGSKEEATDAPSHSERNWVWQSFVPHDLPVSKLKHMVLDHFFGKVEAAKMENHFRLLLPEQGRQMAEQNTVGDETSSGDASSAPIEIILTRVEPKPAELEAPKDTDSPAPTQLDIEKATAGMAKANTERASNTPYSVIDMQVQLRRIFLTLLETACYLQSDNPVVLNLMEQTLDRVRRKCRDYPQVDQDKLRQLINMGFSSARSVRALRMFRQNLRQATDWLIAHPLSTDTRVEEITRGRVQIERSNSPDDNVGTEVAPARDPNSTPARSATTEEMSVQTVAAGPVSVGDYMYSPLLQTPPGPTPRGSNSGNDASRTADANAPATGTSTSPGAPPVANASTTPATAEGETRAGTEATPAPTESSVPEQGQAVQATTTATDERGEDDEQRREEDPLESPSTFSSMPAIPTGTVSVGQKPTKPWNVLLEEVVAALREFHRLHFVPHHGVMESLIEMGFSEEDAEAALLVTGNKRGPACEWLLAGNKGPATSFESGFPKDTPVMHAILHHTTVQMGLMKPKTVAALLNMLEVPMAAQHWLHDPEMNAFLSTVFRIFHAERHNLDRSPYSRSPSASASANINSRPAAVSASVSVETRSTGV